MSITQNPRRESLRDAFMKKASGNGGDASWKLFFPFWKAAVDTTSVVRFLPDADTDNPLGFLVEKHEHELIINGKKKKVPCLEQFGEPCPICELSRQYYSEENKPMGLKYYRKKSYVGQVLVLETPLEHDQTQLVKLIEIGPKIFKRIQAAYKNDDFDGADPDDLKNGFNFRISKTKNGQYPSYDDSSFVRKSTPIADDIIEQLNLYKLSDYIGKKPARDYVEALLLAEQTGQAFGDDEDEDQDPQETQTPAQHSVPKEVPQESPKETPVETAAAPAKPSNGASALELLRQRAAAKKAGQAAQ